MTVPPDQPLDPPAPRDISAVLDAAHGDFDADRLEECWDKVSLAERSLRGRGPVGQGGEVDELHMQIDRLLSRLAEQTRLHGWLRRQAIRRSLAVSWRSLAILGEVEGLYHWVKAFTQWTCIRREAGILRHNAKALTLVHRRVAETLKPEDHRHLDTFELLYGEQLALHETHDDEDAAQVSATELVELARVRAHRQGLQGRFLLARAFSRRADVNWSSVPEDSAADLQRAQALLAEMFHQGAQDRLAAYLDTCWRMAARFIDSKKPDHAEEVLEEGLLCHERARMEDTSYLAVHLYEANAALALERGAEATALLRAERGLTNLLPADRWSQMTLVHLLGGAGGDGRALYRQLYGERGWGEGDPDDSYEDQLRVVARELSDRRLYRAARLFIDDAIGRLTDDHASAPRTLTLGRALVISHSIHLADDNRPQAMRDMRRSVALLKQAFDQTGDESFLPALGHAERCLAGLYSDVKEPQSALSVLRPAFARLSLAVGDEEGPLWQTMLGVAYDLAGLALETRQWAEAVKVGRRLCGPLAERRVLDVTARQDAFYTLEAAALAHIERGEYDLAIRRAQQGRELCKYIDEHTCAAWASASLWQVEARARCARSDDLPGPVIHHALDALEHALDARIDDHGRSLGQHWLPHWVDVKDGGVRARARALLGNIKEEHFLRCVSPPRAGTYERPARRPDTERPR